MLLNSIRRYVNIIIYLKTKKNELPANLLSKLQ